MTVVFNSLASAQSYGMVADRNSKMPGSTWSLSIKHCQIGGKLRDVKGSVCEHCYVIKTERMFKSAVASWDNNLAKFENTDAWSQAMAFQIRAVAKRTGEAFHRWFAAGDLQSPEMLDRIARVCELTPEIQHWLPTRELAHVKAWRQWAAANSVPEPANLVIRISSTMVDDKPRNAPHTSTVHSHGAAHVGHECPSTSEKHRALDPQRKPNCGKCRACWNRSVANVSYPIHD